MELRFPIAGVLHRTAGYGRVPLEGLVFTDAGALLARTNDNAITNVIVRSAGAGVRTNAGGFVVELDAARPIERASPFDSRPNKPLAQVWRMSMNFRPGF